jgi:hypothetical protein
MLLEPQLSKFIPGGTVAAVRLGKRQTAHVQWYSLATLIAAEPPHHELTLVGKQSIISSFLWPGESIFGPRGRSYFL